MKELPLTVKRSIELMGLYVTGMVLYVGSGIITPLLLAFFLSLVMLPVYKFFRKRKAPEILAISLCILVLFIIAGLIGWFFSSQIRLLVADFPSIQKNVNLHLKTLSEWINAKTHFSSEKQLALINEQSNKLLDSAGSMLGGAAASLTSIFVLVGLLPIYIFLLLFYKNLLLKFVFMWFPVESHSKVEEAMQETQVIVKSYLIGLYYGVVGGITYAFRHQACPADWRYFCDPESHPLYWSAYRKHSCRTADTFFFSGTLAYIYRTYYHRSSSVP
jgi:predicted PurR-regulated permease PerM